MDPNVPDYVARARTDASKMGQYASDFAASSFQIPDQLKKVVQEALDYNKDVITNRSQAFTDYMKAPADANVKFGVEKFTTGEQAGQNNQNYIFNPFERNKAISDYVGNQEVPFNMWNKVLGLREGTVADTVNAGTNAFKAAAAAAQGSADVSNRNYENLLNEFKITSDLGLRQQEAARKGSSGDISSLLSMMGGEGGNLTDFFTPENTALMMAMDPDNANKYALIAKTLSAKTPGDTVKNVDSTLTDFLKDYKSTPYTDRANPLSSKGVELQSYKNILTNILAKEIENGRLSDADRQFYLDQMPTGWEPNYLAEAKIKGVQAGLKAKLSGNNVKTSNNKMTSLDSILFD